jgi:prefoldin subunit 5
LHDSGKSQFIAMLELCTTMSFLIFLAFFSATSAIIFECEYKVQYYYFIPRSYFCKVNSYDDDSNQILTFVNGNHQEDKINSDVLGVTLNLKDKNLDYIPRDLEKIFPNIFAIYVYYGKISKLSGNELSELTNLEWFVIENNPLEFLPGNFFRNNKKLKVALFGANKIKYIDRNFFDGLKHLTNVHFGDNICISKRANSALEIESLKIEILEKCQVSENILLEHLLNINFEMESKVNKILQNMNQKIEKLSEENEEIQKQLKAILEALSGSTSAK